MTRSPCEDYYARSNPCHDAATVLRRLDHYEMVYPHKAQGSYSPREFTSQMMEAAIETRSALAVERMAAACYEGYWVKPASRAQRGDAKRLA